MWNWWKKVGVVGTESPTSAPSDSPSHPPPLDGPQLPAHWSQLVLDPAWTFIRTLIFQRGYADGVEGLTIAWMAALYNFVKYAKARNMAPRR